MPPRQLRLHTLRLSALPFFRSLLDKVTRNWKKGELIVEPGESHQETYEFIVLNYVESVLAYTYYRNPRSSIPEGWGATTVHDIVRVTDVVASSPGEVL